MRQWLVDRRTLATALNSDLELAGVVEPVVLNRIWALGRRQMAGRFREFFLVCGANGRDAHILVNGLARILDAMSPVVFVPDALPRGEEWKQAGMTMLRLSQVARVETGTLQVDTAFIEDILQKGGPRATPAATAVFPTPHGATWEEIRLVIGDLSLRAEVRPRGKSPPDASDSGISTCSSLKSRVQCCLTEIDVVLLACRKHVRKASRKHVAVNGYAKNRFSPSRHAEWCMTNAHITHFNRAKESPIYRHSHPAPINTREAHTVRPSCW